MKTFKKRCTECQIREQLKKSGIPETVTVNELSEYLDISARKVQELAREGIISKGSNRGEYNLLDSISNYISYLKDQVIAKRVERRQEW